MTVTFALFRIMPGDPIDIIAQPGRFDPVELDKLRAQFGLDKPIHVQYGLFLKNMLTGNFGLSFFYNRSVGEILGNALKNSVILAVPSLACALTAAMIVGVILGWKSGTVIEMVGIIGTLIIYSVPIYWLSIILLMIFAYGAGWFPTGGMFTPGYQQEGLMRYLSLDFLKHYILPFTASFLYSFPVLFFITRNCVVEVKGKNFMRFLKAKGLPESSQMKHGIRNGLLPVITFMATTASLVVEGNLLLEVAFSWPGIGREIVNAVAKRDYPVAQAGFVIMGLVLIVMNLVADILYAQIDPRISYE
jgi:peptide/nickel transport system permease protein